MAQFHVEDAWWQFVYDDFVEVCKILGIELSQRSVPLYGGGTRQEPEINFDDRSAGWRGKYQYKKGSVTAIKAYAPQDTELHLIAQRLCDAQKRAFYGAYAYVKPSYRNNIAIDADNVMHLGYAPSDDIQQEIETGLEELTGWLHRRLMAEYEYLLDLPEDADEEKEGEE